MESISICFSFYVQDTDGNSKVSDQIHGTVIIQNGGQMTNYFRNYLDANKNSSETDKKSSFVVSGKHRTY